MAAIHPATQTQDLRPFQDLLLHGEVKEMARRVVSAAAYFFQVVACQISAIVDEIGFRFVLFLLNPSEDVVRFALSLCTPEMDAAEKTYIIKVIDEVAADQREDVVRLAPWLFTPKMDRFDKGQIIKAVARLAADQREAVVRFALSLCTSEMHGFDKSQIIEAIVLVAADQREAVVHLALSLCTPKMNRSDKAQIIHVIAQLAADQREDVVRFALSLCTPEMDGFNKRLIIKAIARLAADQREDVIRLATPLFTPEESGFYKFRIIVEIARIAADQREDVIHHALREITPEMDVLLKCDIIQEIARLPAEQRADFRLVHLRGREADVHAGNRDQKTREAIELLREKQGPLTDQAMEEALQAFTSYLEASSVSESDKALVKKVLFTPREPNETFSPLIDEEGFSILGLRMTGIEILARHWIFASSLQELEQTNAKYSIIRALVSCYEDGARVCNQGKTQRLVVAVLQGRLRGVNIEENLSQQQIPTPQAMAMFFNIPVHRDTGDQASLLAAANCFCAENALVNREDFLAQINEYANQQLT